MATIKPPYLFPLGRENAAQCLRCPGRCRVLAVSHSLVDLQRTTKASHPFSPRGPGRLNWRSGSLLQCNKRNFVECRRTHHRGGAGNLHSLRGCINQSGVELGKKETRPEGKGEMMRYFFLGYNVDARFVWSRHHTSVFAKKLKGRAHQSLPPNENRVVAPARRRVLACWQPRQAPTCEAGAAKQLIRT